MENKKSFSIRKTLSESWGLVRAEFWKFVLVSLILLGASFVSGLVEDRNALYSVLSFLLQVYLGLVWLIFAVRTVEKKKLVFKEVFREINARLYMKFLLLSIVVTLAIIAGTILLIIPGIMLALGLQFAGYYMADNHDVSVKDALKRSWQGTKGLKWKLLWFVIVLGLINILGMMVLGIGLLVTVPLTSLALASIYVHVIENRNIPASDSSK